MTPQDALAKALERAYRDAGMNRAADLGAQHEEARLVLAALAADGWTVARTQDARDGEALDRLQLALRGSEVVDLSSTQPARRASGRRNGWWCAVRDARTPSRDDDLPCEYGKTIADSADACREAIEATR